MHWLMAGVFDLYIKRGKEMNNNLRCITGIFIILMPRYYNVT
jgi:hypothetical protein